MTTASGRDRDSIKELAAFDAANGWPFDLGSMVVIYALLRVIGLLRRPTGAIPHVAARRPR